MKCDCLRCPEGPEAAEGGAEVTRDRKTDHVVLSNGESERERVVVFKRLY